MKFHTIWLFVRLFAYQYKPGCSGTSALRVDVFVYFKLVKRNDIICHLTRGFPDLSELNGILRGSGGQWIFPTTMHCYQLPWSWRAVSLTKVLLLVDFKTICRTDLQMWVKIQHHSYQYLWAAMGTLLWGQLRWEPVLQKLQLRCSVQGTEDRKMDMCTCTPTVYDHLFLRAQKLGPEHLSKEQSSLCLKTSIPVALWSQ